MSDTKLKSCPFCGGEARMQHYRNGDCAIECIECYGKTHRSVTEDLAIRRWNTRKPIDRIVEQLEEVSFVDIDEQYADDGQRMLFLYDAISIVDEVAQEYNNGWIPCSERLPDEATTYQVTEEVVVNSKKQYNVDIRLFGTEGEWLCPSNRKIIAWQPLPLPFKEGGSDD